ncbi:MAG: hypothetical protein AAF559_14285 [Pseudomonadota bacterium]
MREDNPTFDFIFVNFPDLTKFTIARGIEALDTMQALNDYTFSAIVWDEPEIARFIIVDAQTGAIETARSLDFRRSGKSATEAADPEGAAVDNSRG